MVDLSEGGMSCAVPPGVTLDAGARVVVELTIGGSPMELAAEVVRIGELPLDETAVAVRFTAITSKTADRIRKEVFALQALQRSRGVA